MHQWRGLEKVRSNGVSTRDTRQNAGRCDWTIAYKGFTKCVAIFDAADKVAHHFPKTKMK